ncbi:amino acid ABC transporter permease [Ancylobacter mangrovi]|uniref:amino acid ABC transporter permease n=1 Tax=Ancylobacter mangrovi TaxID=2972472 RepID=UPI002163B90E|nr:amino acid ABC transporter permease [Ancylobacter mangrovi]MCS0502160.1 amino acid ABC transporter permease [Ancylobacter mangrovi]
MIEFALAYAPRYFMGTLVGLGLTVFAMAGALVLGLLVALGRQSRSRVLRAICVSYVAVFRGVPPLVLLYVVYFGLPAWAVQSGIPGMVALFSPLDNRLASATLAFAVNAGAYVAEILRASMMAVPADQMDAARSIGMTYPTALRRILLPQAFRIAFPPLGNEFIIILKGTSLASVIGVTELMRTAQNVAAATFLNLQAYLLAAFFYVALVILLQGASTLVERRLRRPGDHDRSLIV